MIIIRLTTVALFALLFTVTAQGEELFDVSLEELMQMKVFSASRRETEALHVSAMVTVITEEDMARWGVENLGDALKYASGMTIRKAHGDFPQYLAAVRGNTSDFMNSRTLFLIDGVPMRNPNAGFDPSWIPVAIVKRVEIVKGPLSNLWGANAFGGVVHIVTKTGADFHDQNVKVAGGYRTKRDRVRDSDTGGASGAVTAGQAGTAIDYMAAASYMQSEESAKSYTGHRYQDVFAKLIYHANEKLDLSLRSLTSLDRSQLALDNAGGPMKSDVSHLAANADWKLAANSSLSATAYLNDFSHFIDYTDRLDFYDNEGRSYGITTQYSTLFNDKHSLVAGADLVNDSGYLSTNSNNYSTFPPTLEFAGWSTKFQTTWGAYAQYEYLGWEKYKPTAGVRYDHNSLFGGALSPRVGLAYLLNERNSLFASVGSGFRAPVFNETDIQGFGKVGHQDLKPEINTTFEVGLKNTYQTIQNTIAIFKQDISNKIELQSIDPTNPNSNKRYENSGKGTINGIEVETAYTPRKGVRAFFNSTLLDSDDGDGGRIEKLIQVKVVLGATVAVNSWSFSVVGIHEGDQFFYDSSSNRVLVDKVTTANFEMGKRFAPGFAATLFVNNIADRRYVEEYAPFIEPEGFYLPGRTIGLTLNAGF